MDYLLLWIGVSAVMATFGVCRSYRDYPDATQDEDMPTNTPTNPVKDHYLPYLA